MPWHSVFAFWSNLEIKSENKTRDAMDSMRNWRVPGPLAEMTSCRNAAGCRRIQWKAPKLSWRQWTACPARTVLCPWADARKLVLWKSHVGYFDLKTDKEWCTFSIRCGWYVWKRTFTAFSCEDAPWSQVFSTQRARVLCFYKKHASWLFILLSAWLILSWMLVSLCPKHLLATLQSDEGWMSCRLLIYQSTGRFNDWSTYLSIII